jgi:ketosteroid isomerase-like protein
MVVTRKAMRRFLGWVLLPCLACDEPAKIAPSQPTPTASSRQFVAAPSAAPSASVPRAQPSAARSPPTSHEAPPDEADAQSIHALVGLWNEAINAHDARTLAALYADPVELYGTSMPRARALAAKRASFAKHAKDELSDIHVSTRGHAQFRKKSTSRDGRVVEVTGYLEARETSGRWLIESEGDTTTDANLARAMELRCEAAVDSIVYATAEAKMAIKRINDGLKNARADDPVNLSGMIVPPNPGNAAWSVGICENHEDRMPCPYSFEVDPHTAVVTAFDVDGPKALKTDPALAAKVREACK